MAERIEKPEALKFHRDAFEHAKKLIRQGKVNCTEDSWTVDEPTPDDENIYLADHSLLEYGQF
jgi:hypothetical protein